MQGGAVQAGILPFKLEFSTCRVQPPLGKKKRIVIQPLNFKIEIQQMTWDLSGLNVFLNLKMFVDMLKTKHKRKYSIERVWVSNMLVRSVEDGWSAPALLTVCETFWQKWSYQVSLGSLCVCVLRIWEEETDVLLQMINGPDNAVSAHAPRHVL